MMDTANNIMSSNYASMSKQELIAALENHRQTLQAFYTIIHQPNTKMSPGEKLLLIAARCILPQEKPNEQGLVRLPYDRAANFIGMSESSASRYGNALTKRFNATNEPVEYTTKKGQDCILTYVKPDDPLWVEPWNIDLPEEKKRTLNGNGKYCENCKTYNLQVTTRRITYQEVQECECCGYVKISPVLTDKEELTPGEYIPEKKGLQAEEPFSAEQETEKAQISAPLTSINTPPAPQEKKVPSLESFLQKRLGEGQNIYSTGDIEEVNLAKYYSFDVGHQLDIAAYIRGELKHIYGSPLRLADGRTWVLSFDIDEKDTVHFARRRAYMKALARAGAAPVCWLRRQGTCHIELYFDQSVKPADALAWCVSVCPQLATIEECYPVNQKNNGRVSWPLYHRIGNTVYECKAEFVFPDRPDEIILSAGIKTHPNSLPWNIQRAVTPAALIPALPVVEQPQNGGVVLLDTPLPTHTVGLYDDGLKAIILAEYDKLPWPEVVNGEIKSGRFLSPLHDEDKPSVVIQGKYATDYGRTPSGRVETKDKFDWYWLTRGKNPRAELRRLCDECKQRREDIAS